MGGNPHSALEVAILGANSTDKNKGVAVGLAETKRFAGITVIERQNRYPKLKRAPGLRYCPRSQQLFLPGREPTRRQRHGICQSGRWCRHDGVRKPRLQGIRNMVARRSVEEGRSRSLQSDQVFSFDFLVDGRKNDALSPIARRSSFFHRKIQVASPPSCKRSSNCSQMERRETSDNLQGKSFPRRRLELLPSFQKEIIERMGHQNRRMDIDGQCPRMVSQWKRRELDPVRRPCRKH